ncbi:hypothetical protein BH719_02105 [Pauljensenia hongkongensis]|uniref:Uncharacterized protein n=1 Tax=Pauljensenia hongkongensis TaxID=178339 RepID=A0A1D8B0Y4_9ACTO|nr:hypothetical protein BH719_02105 [Pauljensenia hongkongensis]
MAHPVIRLPPQEHHIRPHRHHCDHQNGQHHQGTRAQPPTRLLVHGSPLVRVDPPRPQLRIPRQRLTTQPLHILAHHRRHPTTINGGPVVGRIVGGAVVGQVIDRIISGRIVDGAVVGQVIDRIISGRIVDGAVVGQAIGRTISGQLADRIVGQPATDRGAVSARAVVRPGGTGSGAAAKPTVGRITNRSAV